VGDSGDIHEKGEKGKVKSNAMIRLRRFTVGQRIFHLLLMLSFLTQGATGLARMYIETSWGKTLASVFGGYESALTVHKFSGFVMMGLFLAHILYVVLRINWRDFPNSVLGPESLIPQPYDIREFFHHVCWFLGLIRAPRFDRWGYWEKFDYWAVFWGIPILGITGLLLGYPLVSTRIVPGWGLNIAFSVHRDEAILAMGYIFVVHFFRGHLRRTNFPMDRAMFEGSVDLDVANHEKPFWVARLAQTGKLQSLLVPESRPAPRILFYAFGYSAMAVGVFLLIGGLLNSPYITW
jgi:cytochrome b subunit of formate dehydrogenase